MLSSIITILLIIILRSVILIAGIIALFLVLGLILFLGVTISSVIIVVWGFICDIIRKLKRKKKVNEH